MREPIIHRMALRGRSEALCGAKGVALSNYGVHVTCPDCQRLSAPISPDEAMRQIMAAAERFRLSQSA